MRVAIAKNPHPNNIEHSVVLAQGNSIAEGIYPWLQLLPQYVHGPMRCALDRSNKLRILP